MKILQGTKEKINPRTSKLPEARENASDHVATTSFSLNLIGRESDTSFLDQSQSEIKKNRRNPGLLPTLKDLFTHLITEAVAWFIGIVHPVRYSSRCNGCLLFSDLRRSHCCDLSGIFTSVKDNRENQRVTSVVN